MEADDIFGLVLLAVGISAIVYFSFRFLKKQRK